MRTRRSRLKTKAEPTGTAVLALHTILSVLGLLACVPLVLEVLGVDLPQPILLHLAESLVLLGFMVDHFRRIYTERRTTWLWNWDLAIGTLGLIALATMTAEHVLNLLPPTTLLRVVQLLAVLGFTAGRLVRLARAIPDVATALDIILAVTGAAAVVTLVLEYGFRPPYPVGPGILLNAQRVIIVVFVLDRVLRLVFSRAPLEYLKENWIDFGLIAGAVVVIAISYQMRLKVVSVGTLYVFISQAYILITLLLRGITVNIRLAESGLPPTWLLIGSFLGLILVGSGLLVLPASHPEGVRMPYDDALFTATSATCVTGLIVVDTGSDFTPFGQAVILVLIQLGGLGIMLFGTVMAMLVGKGLTVRGSSAIGEMMATEKLGRFRSAAIFLLVITLLTEIVGASLLYPMFRAVPDTTTGKAVWDSVFHSISAFCNAGFSLYAKNLAAGVDPSGADAWARPLRNHWQILGVMAPLIVLGGLGFPVLEDCWRWLRRRIKRLAQRSIGKNVIGPPPRLTLHSKLVLTTSVVLILVGAIVLMMIEPLPGRGEGRIGLSEIKDAPEPIGDWTHMGPLERGQQALFASVTARTAGFNTFDMAELSTAGKMWMCFLMAIGGSPASTAGGMKTATFALLLLATLGVLRRREEVELFHRSLAQELLRKATTLATLYMFLVIVTTLLLSVALRGVPFDDVMFEAFSACGTVGLSTGVTGKLDLFGKLVVIGAMFAGRLGPLTMLLALMTKMRTAQYTYPTETVVIG
ncbi:MAG: TrkH family potassium uptake protein [Phycisphaerae bacterium]